MERSRGFRSGDNLDTGFRFILQRLGHDPEKVVETAMRHQKAALRHVRKLRVMMDTQPKEKPWLSAHVLGALCEARHWACMKRRARRYL